MVFIRETAGLFKIFPLLFFSVGFLNLGLLASYFHSLIFSWFLLFSSPLSKLLFLEHLRMEVTVTHRSPFSVSFLMFRLASNYARGILNSGSFLKSL